MADVNANIGVNIDASEALAQLKSLQRQIAQFHSSVAKSSEAAGLAQRDLQRNFINGVNSIQGFSAELRTVKTTAESFTDSLERNKFSMREYFRYSAASTKTFGRLFRSEFDTVNKVAVENVKRLQTQYIKMGRDASGAMKAIAIMPTQLDMTNLSTKTQLAAQKQALFNQLVKQGSTNLLNFGKNTQWAGRQLMVGFTLPLMALGTVATKSFMDMETAALKFRKVYGDLFTPAEETNIALENVKQLAENFTRYGIAVSDTVSLAAEAAAAGFQGLDLQRQTTEATRLQVLGQIDQQKALETTIALQNAFQMQSEDLSGAINFLNAVENQTVVSLDDITTAIPKAAPVVRQLGGDVKDLAFFMAAMKEGGINASEGANALKSGLASLINPTDKATQMMAGFGINIDEIVNKNAGNVKQTVIEFAQALDGLSNLNRQRAIEQLFGKFQLARLSTLFENVTKNGNQASRVLDLATASTEDLAAMADKELGMTADSAMNKFRSSVEQLKLALVPVGEVFLKVVTPFIEKIGDILDRFNNLSDGTKRVLTVLTVGIGAIAPVVLMTIGLLANFVANGIKGLALVRNGFLRLTGQSKILGEQTQYLTVEQQNAVAAAASLEQSHMKLQQAFTGEAGAVKKLIIEYQRMMDAQNRAATVMPGMMRPGFKPKKFAKGITSVPGPKGAGDIVPAMLSPGEAIIPAEMTKKYGALINGMIADNIPGYETGLGIGKIKKQAGLYKAPSAVLAQTGALRWETLPNEIKAVSEAVKDFGLTQNQVINLLRRQASHISEDIQTIKVGNESVSIKNWKAKNLISDMGYINNYVDTLRKNSSILENFRKTDLDVVAKDLGMSMQQLDTELEKLKSGIHPVTRTSASVLQRVASTDPGYQGVAASAGLRARLAGNFYETVGQRSYDPAFDLSSAKSVDRKIIKMQQLAGAQLANASIQSIQSSAKTASPSRRTIPIGEDIARGLQVGMINQVDETAKAGGVLSSAAVGGVQGRRGRRRATRPQGPPMPLVAGPMLGPSAPTRRDRTIGRVAGRARTATAKVSSRFAGRGRGVGVGATGALFAASMLPGKLGEVASKASMAAFALSSLAFLPGPLKLVGAGLLATYGIIKLVNIARENERKKLEAFSDVVSTSTEEIKGLSEQFNFIPVEGTLKSFSKNLEATSVATRNAREEIKKTEAFQSKQNKNRIEGLKRLSDDQAQTALQFLGVNLISQGMAKDQVQIFIDAIKEEAGKTQLKFNFKDIKIDNDLFSSLNKDLKKSLTKTGFDKEFSEVFNKINKTVRESFDAVNYSEDQLSAAIFGKAKGQLKSEIKNAGALIKSYFETLNNLVTSGSISTEGFKKATAGMFDSINKAIPNTNAQMAIYDQILTSIDPKLKKVVLQVKDHAEMELILTAALAGVNAQLIANASAAFATAFAMNKLAQENLKLYGVTARTAEEGYKIGKALADEAYWRKKLEEGIISEIELKKILNGITENGGTKDGKDLSFFNKELKMLNRKRDALKEVNSELDRQYQYTQKQMQLMSEATQAKISGNYIQAAMIGQQSISAAGSFARESKELQLDKLIKLTEARKSAADKRKSLTASDKSFRSKLRSGDYGSVAPLAKTPNTGLNYPTGGAVYNINMNLNGIQNGKELFGEFKKELQKESNKNNKSNKVAI